MIYLYTHQPNSYTSLEAIKRYARFFLRKSRGPQAVNASLIRGLNEIGYDYKLNDTHPVLDDQAALFINDSVDALRWAINLKKKREDIQANSWSELGDITWARQRPYRVARN
jgi:hypothetical protein